MKAHKPGELNCVETQKHNEHKHKWNGSVSRDIIGSCVDTTDHLMFFCKECKKAVEVCSVSTEFEKYDHDKEPFHCTRILLYCDVHGHQVRKFYWPKESNEFLLSWVKYRWSQ